MPRNNAQEAILNASARLSTVACSGSHTPAVGGGPKHQVAPLCSSANAKRTEETSGYERKKAA